MKRVYSSFNSMLVDNLCNVLQQEGVPSEVRNRHSTPLLGTIPLSEAFTELWVDDEHVERAEEVVRGFVRDVESPQYEGNWTCAVCNTEIEETFDSCWKCAESDRQETDRRPALSASRNLVGRTPQIGPLALWIAAALLGLLWISSQL